jgi:tetratricopeptide (TPR) repeat protein
MCRTDYINGGASGSVQPNSCPLREPGFTPTLPHSHGSSLVTGTELARGSFGNRGIARNGARVGRGRAKHSLLAAVIVILVAIFPAFPSACKSRTREGATPNERQGAAASENGNIAARMPHLAALRQSSTDESQESAGKSSDSPAATGDGLEQLPADADTLLAECDRVLDALSSDFSSLPDVHEVRARYMKWRGNSAEAERHWQKCLELDPDYGHAYFGMAKVAAQRGMLEDSVELFKKARAVMPNFLEVEVELSRALINLDRAQEAIDVLEARPKGYPLSAEALCVLGQAYLEEKKDEQARDRYQAAIAAEPESVEAHFGLATAMARLGQTATSAEYFRRFRDLKSKFMARRTAERVSFEDLPAMREDIASFYSTVGKIHFVNGKVADAERIWRRAAVLDPSNIECRQSLAWLYRNSGRLEKTIEVLDELATLSREKTTYWLEIGRLRARMSDFEGAERQFQKVGDASPSDPAGYAPLVELYLDFNRKLPDALRLARKVVDLKPSPQGYLLLAAALDRNGDLPGAKSALEQGLKLDPKNIACYLDLGRVNFVLNDIESAEKAIRAAIAIAPEKAAGYSELAKLYLVSAQKEKLSESIELARKAVQLEPSPEAYLLLSETCRINGLDSESDSARINAAMLESERRKRQRPNVGAAPR